MKFFHFLLSLCFLIGVGCAKSPEIYTFSQSRIYLVNVRFGDSKVKPFIVPGGQLQSMLSVYMFPKADYWETIERIHDGMTLNLPKRLELEDKGLLIPVLFDEGVDSIFKAQGIRGLILHYFQNNPAGVSLKQSYLAKLLIENGIQLSFSDENASYYLAAETFHKLGLSAFSK
ncbi:MAG: hypothetical protein DRJ14_08405 [Acidobacteria bacterium]|nr:MAG: hypothetical protein DRJ14_08405 [Acidobacteriota bacterium]